MRKIKFRQAIFINNKINSWHYWGYLKSGFEPPITNFQANFEGRCDAEIKPDQQYTGRKDKNGTEIYEGDIIQREVVKSVFHCHGHHLKDKTVTELGKVEWNKNELSWWIIGSDGRHFPLSYLGGNDTEIIDNISNNPELLKEKA